MREEKEKSANLANELSLFQAKMRLHKKEQEMVELESKLKDIFEAIQF